ncbi:nitrate- and nitrite sensing domain-containing protein [Nocardiopsis sp. ARC36]
MPHEKRRSLRARMITLVLIPSTALLLLWAAFTAVLVTDIRELRTTAALTEQVATPVITVIGELQRERRATMDSANGTERTAHRLRTTRQETTEAVEALRLRLRAFDEDDLPEQALNFQRSLNRLEAHRQRVDALSPGERTLEEAATAYTEIIESGLRVWDAQVERADSAQVPHLRSLTSLARTRELLNQQDAVLAHAVATNAFPAEAHAEFAAAAGAQRYTWGRVGAELNDQDSQHYILLESYSALQSVYQLQESIISMPIRGENTVPVNATAWRGAAEAVDLRMRGVEEARTEQVVAFSHTQSAELRNSALLISVPALVAALASSAVAVGGTQRLGRRLQHLRVLTLEHAQVRLPEVTARLRAGQRGRGRRGPQTARAGARRDRPDGRGVQRRPAGRGRAPPWRRPRSAPGCAPCSATSHAARSRSSTASWGCWTPWNGARPTPRCWRRCSASTTSAPSCGATPRTSCC